MIVDSVLLVIFGLQHSVMARPSFKQIWASFVPDAIERSTYVIASSLALIAMFVCWQPMQIVVWDVQNPIGRGVIFALFACGWLTILMTTCLINPFDLFGLQQVWLYFRCQAYKPPGFVTPGPYKFVRHPLYVGWLTAFWAIPTMTASHLMIAGGMTVYVLIAIVFEERNLAQSHGRRYHAYRRRTPMLLPLLSRRLFTVRRRQPTIEIRQHASSSHPIQSELHPR